MILAATKPEVVQKLVIWGANSYVIPEEIQSYESKHKKMIMYRMFLLYHIM